jgi:hypothetical protein
MKNILCITYIEKIKIYNMDSVAMIHIESDESNKVEIEKVVTQPPEEEQRLKKCRNVLLATYKRKYPNNPEMVTKLIDLYDLKKQITSSSQSDEKTYNEALAKRNQTKLNRYRKVVQTYYEKKYPNDIEKVNQLMIEFDKDPSSKAIEYSLDQREKASRALTLANYKKKFPDNPEIVERMIYIYDVKKGVTKGLNLAL